MCYPPVSACRVLGNVLAQYYLTPDVTPCGAGPGGTGGHRLDAPYARGVVEASAARGVVPESGLGCTVVPVRRGAMRKLAVIAAAVAVLGATTAAVSVASASAAPKNG